LPRTTVREAVTPSLEEAVKAATGLWFQEQDRLFNVAVKDPPQMRAAAQDELVAMATEAGLSRDEIVNLYETNPILRDHRMQKVLYDAAKYRLAEKRAAAFRVQPRQTPPPQRPGTSSGRTTSAEAELRAAERAFENATTANEGIRAAVRLRQTRRAARG
jgi:hypothetical protein